MTKTTILGRIENWKTLFFRLPGNRDHFYFVSADEGFGWSEFYTKYGPTLPADSDYKSASGADLDNDEYPFFMVYVADCFDPPIAIVRAANAEEAIDVAVDAFDWLKVEPHQYGTEAEFEQAVEDGTAEITDGGAYYDAEQINVRPIELFRVEME